MRVVTSVRMGSRGWLSPVAWTLGLLFVAGAGSIAGAADAKRPNVVVIVADDLGYGDLGFQGGTEIPTPHLDRLAKGGTRCTNGYVSCPVCSPTRAGLFTGRYQQRFGHEFNPGQITGAEQDQFGLPTTEITLADQLKKVGYHTGLVGKWHLGFSKRFQPASRGFDESFGFLGGAHPYLPGKGGVSTGIFRNGKEVQEEAYLTDAFGREASAYIERNSASPFLLFLTFNGVHTPLQAPQKKLDQFKHITENKRQSYAAMLSSVDDAIGSVLDQLDKSGVADRTAVFFISDNGGPTQANASRNTPLSGVKATVWEGGIRVPFVVRWPGQVPAGAVYDEPVISLDIFATASAAAGVPLPSDRHYDSVNLIPHLKGEAKTSPHPSLYWRFGAQHAIRQGQYKLLKLRDGEEHLFDLSQDVGEQKDLLASHPEVADRLRQEYARWNAELHEPLWTGGGGGGRKRQQNRNQK
jgi:arylsulfatase A-like enzyme